MVEVQRWEARTADGVLRFETRSEAEAAGGQVRRVSITVPAVYRLWDPATETYIGDPYEDVARAAGARKKFPGSQVRIIPAE